jgi:hypothetical protein
MVGDLRVHEAARVVRVIDAAKHERACTGSRAAVPAAALHREDAAGGRVSVHKRTHQIGSQCMQPPTTWTSGRSCVCVQS